MAGTSITKRTVDAAKPAAKDHFVWDDDISGFGLKVTPAGGKIYVYQYRIARPGEAARTPAKRYTIGKHGNLTPDEARKRAKELAALVERGIDPRQQELNELAAEDEAKRQAQEMARIEGELAFKKVSALWLDHYENEKARRPSSVSLAKLVVNRYLTPVLGEKPMPHIGRADIQPIIDAIPVRRKGMRRAVFAYASVLFGWTARRGDIASNPLTEMVKPEAPKSRDRVLTDTELTEVWNASEKIGTPFGPFFRLLILTGQRRSEVAGMSWTELDRASSTWTIPADRAKNGVAHIVPLSTTAIAELDGLADSTKSKEDKSDEVAWPKTGFVLTTTGKTPISGLTKAKNALDAAIIKARRGDEDVEELEVESIPAWRLHDLRRTLATGFQRLGIRFEVTEAVLNHVSGAKGGIAGIYQRHDWKEEKRSALDAWARHVASIITPAEQGNVVALGSSKNVARRLRSPVGVNFDGR
ncbi:tyrosine-type recombinase/integrase [Novosphingobium album (ex Liu et al. 2023)]|uniref:Integrase arm-type DNA-binding domain-containing protein n=1 Tax=Novosphingobium album (ex Liu et al. 2023) TaxID=3031130 RepID=A0ABT5WVZ2_9SPHN|nr:site-specific integrase [Novosphingobium album (ex Liu et al. 2023)]MDE8654057.1 integrase arm-type DNA-binding domain-containing protein [Novosphingobium album (ex Liu et al. 2023)]